MAEASESGILYHSTNVRSWRDEGHFTVPRVVYRGQKGTYALFEQMTSEMIQDKLSEFYESEKSKGNPVPTDAPLIWAIATRAHELKGENPEAVGKIRQLLQIGFRRYPNTLTRIDYSPENDVVVHNAGTSDQYSLEGNVVGPDGFINNIPDKNILESLLGTQDVSKINAVSQWINETDTYLWRLNSKPKKFNKRVAGFNAHDCLLGPDCNWGPLGVCPAFRVLQVE